MTLVVILTLNFQGQIWNLLYLSQNGLIAKKQKANISIELKPQTSCYQWVWLGHDLDIWILKVKCNLGGPIYIEQRGGIR